VKAEFSVDTEAQMNTLEETNVWEAFIDNFRASITTGIEYKELNKKALEEVRKTRLLYMGWTILGAAIGGVIGIFFSRLTGNNFIGYIAIPIMASFFLNRSINQRKRNVLSV
jgi:putative Mn2+ efflux pump MntP